MILAVLYKYLGKHECMDTCICMQSAAAAAVKVQFVSLANSIATSKRVIIHGESCMKFTSLPPCVDVDRTPPPRA